MIGKSVQYFVVVYVKRVENAVLVAGVAVYLTAFRIQGMNFNHELLHYRVLSPIKLCQC